MLVFCDNLLIATLLPFPNSVRISDFYCTAYFWQGLKSGSLVGGGVNDKQFSSVGLRRMKKFH